MLMSFNNKPLVRDQFCSYAGLHHVTLHSIWQLEFPLPRPISDAIPVPLPDAPRNLQLREFARSNIEVTRERERGETWRNPRKRRIQNNNNEPPDSKADDFQCPQRPHMTRQFPVIVQAILADENIEDNSFNPASS